MPTSISRLLSVRPKHRRNPARPRNDTDPLACAKMPAPSAIRVDRDATTGRTGRALGAAGFCLLMCMLVGCASLGIRPDESDVFNKKDNACNEYMAYRQYSKNLQEAYHSRASQNRFGIYASGGTALGTVAAGAIMAASAVSSTTIGIVSISGGLASGLFGLADNPTLAQVYTTAANRLETAVQEAEAMLITGQDGSRYKSYPECATALRHLRTAVAQSKNSLEQARTDSAAASVQRAITQAQQIRQFVAEAQDQEVSQAVRKGEIVQVSGPIASGTDSVLLTVANVNFDTIAFADVKVSIAGEIRPVSWDAKDAATGNYTVKFTPPANPPVAGQKGYPLTLLVGKSQTRIECRPGVSLKYQ